jgi:hypothetical protein
MKTINATWKGEVASKFSEPLEITKKLIRKVFIKPTIL